jgi:uncharacterized protein
MLPSVQPPARRPARRGPVRRFAETRGLVGGHRSPHVVTRLRARDGTALRASYLPGPAAAPTSVLLLHGFGAHRRKPAYAALADGLAAVAPVLALDLRGHGTSSGASTFGDREEADVHAGVAWLRAYGHRHLVVVGASMGATAAIHALWRGSPADALVAISAPARFRDPAPVGPLQRLETLWHSDLQRGLLRAGLGVRLAGPRAWRSPPDPERMVAELTQPLLLVHGDDDAYFPVDDAHRLAAQHAGPSAVWHEPSGFGHAEDGLRMAFIQRLGQAVIEVARTGRFLPGDRGDPASMGVPPGPTRAAGPGL